MRECGTFSVLPLENRPIDSSRFPYLEIVARAVQDLPKVHDDAGVYGLRYSISANRKVTN
jgi:hypothetical protein